MTRTAARRTYWLGGLVVALSCQGSIGGLAGMQPELDGGQRDSGGIDAGFADAGRSGDAGSFDAGRFDAGTPDASVVPAGLVPIIVVSGRHGRLVSSCDDGRSWVAHDEVVAPSDDAQFNDKGLAYTDGVFAHLIGWGAQCSFKFSNDGQTWRHLQLADVGLPPLDECAGLSSTGDAFLMVHAAGSTYLSRDAGRAWSEVTPVVHPEYLRDVGGGGSAPGVAGTGGANDASGVIKRVPHFTVDRGQTWKDAVGCSNGNEVSIGQNGGIAYGNHTLVFVGFLGQVCASSDLVTFQESQLALGGNAIEGRASFANGQFWAAHGATLFVSTDGVTWVTRQLPSGVRIDGVGGAENTGTLVAYSSGGSFYRSTDKGLTWAPAQGPGGSSELGRVVFGYGNPSAACPLP